MRRLPCLAPVAALALALSAGASAQSGIPRLQQHGSATQLVVDGKPFLIIGGELGNSSASSVLEFRKSWPTLAALHVNTILAPAYWELIEPQEGRFNFSSVDSLIADARRHDIRIVFLWFGTWKNSMSTYVPAYVKANQRLYPRTESVRGSGQEILAPYHLESARTDARAFAALMRHLRAFDGAKHTVLMVQVENETGMIPTARDHSAFADSLFAAPVPDALMSYLSSHRQALVPALRSQWEQAGGRASGSWEEVFGVSPATDELFMAWHFARYHEVVAAAGKKEYPLPMYANAALIRPGYAPGRYVSAGPLPHLIDIWRAASPSTDFIAPDIYFPNFVEWADRYARTDNPLFVPEAEGSPLAAVNALYAIGRRNAIGFNPFSIENIDAASSPIAKSFAMLRQLAPLIVAHQGLGTMSAAIPPIAFDGTIDATAQVLTLSGADYNVKVSFANPPGPPTANPGAAVAELPAQVNRPRGCIVVKLAPDEFLVAGIGVMVTFTPTSSAGFAGIVRAEEGRYDGTTWKPGRRLNGDQTNQGRQLILGGRDFVIQRVKLYTYR